MTSDTVGWMGDLERIWPGRTAAPRTIWESEVEDFSTWLAGPQGVRVISSCLECELIRSGLEIRTQSGTADIVFDIADFESGKPIGRKVIVEGFLRWADDDHFLRLQHYAAASNALASALVAPAFPTKMLRTMAYLNRQGPPGGGGIAALKIDCFRIGHRSTCDMVGIEKPHPDPHRAAAPHADWLAQAAAEHERIADKDGIPCEFSGCGRKLRFATCAPDVFFEMGPSEDNVLLALVFDAACEFEARNYFLHSRKHMEAFLAEELAPWDPTWQRRDKQRLASRVFGAIGRIDPQPAVQLVNRVLPIANAHIAKLSRHPGGIAFGQE